MLQFRTFSAFAYSYQVERPNIFNRIVEGISRISFGLDFFIIAGLVFFFF